MNLELNIVSNNTIFENILHYIISFLFIDLAYNPSSPLLFQNSGSRKDQSINIEHEVEVFRLDPEPSPR